MTTINSASTGAERTLDIAQMSNGVMVGVDITKHSYNHIVVDREEFAQAVRDLGFVVIDKAELPEVKFFADGAAYAETDRGFGEYTLEPRDTPERLIGHAKALLALAEYLETNPPIDPKVEVLAELFRAAVGVTPESSAAGHLIPSSSAEVAARMWATGRIDIKEAS